MRKISGLGTRERISPHKRVKVRITSRGRQCDDNPTSDENGSAPIKKIYGLGTRERKTPPKLFEGLRRSPKPRPSKKPNRSRS